MSVFASVVLPLLPILTEGLIVITALIAYELSKHQVFYDSYQQSYDTLISGHYTVLQDISSAMTCDKIVISS